MILKKIGLSFFFILVIFFSNSNADNRIFYIDMDVIINNSNAGKVIIKDLNQINKANLSELKSKQKEIKKMEDEIDKVKNIILEDELNNKINSLKKQILIFRNNKDKKIKEFNIKKQNEINILLKKVLPIIEEFMKKKSISIILEKKNLFIADKDYDITSEILILVNEKLK